MDKALLLIAHGSRKKEWGSLFYKLKEKLVIADPSTPVELAFLEFMTPSIEDALNSLFLQGKRKILVWPLFLGVGGHVAKDIPRKLSSLGLFKKGAFCCYLPSLAEDNLLLDAFVQCGSSYLKD